MKTGKKTAAEVRREVMELLGTDGLRAAAEATIAVCRDPNAAAPAKATAAGLIMRATSLGGFGKTEDDDGTKSIEELTPAEMQQRIDSLRSQAAERMREMAEMWGETDDVDDEADDRPGSLFD